MQHGYILSMIFFIFSMKIHGMRDYFVIMTVERNIFYALCKAIIFFAFKWEKFYWIFEFSKKLSFFRAGKALKKNVKVTNAGIFK